jgi:hypothetical protein
MSRLSQGKKSFRPQPVPNFKKLGFKIGPFVSKVRGIIL